MKTILTILFLFTLSLAALGQDGAIAESLTAKAKAQKIQKEVLISYDKFKDQTSIFTKPQNLITGMEAFAVGLSDSLERGPYGSGRTSGYPTVLLFMIGHVFKGQPESIRPEKYTLIVTSSSSSWIFLKGDKNLYFLFDGERLELAPIDSDRDIGGRATVSESLAFELSRSDLDRLAKAKSVELKLGPIPRKLKPEVLERFKKLDALLGN